MFREALDYPTRPPHGGRTVIVGGVMSGALTALLAVGRLGRPYVVVSVLALVPWFLVRGYYVRVLRSSIGRADPRPPAFRDYGRLFGDGARAAAITLVYVLPALVVLAPLAHARQRGVDLAAVLLSAGLPDAVAAGVLSAVGVLALFALMYLLGALYAVPVAVARFAYTGRLRAAFDIRTVVSGATTEDYVVAWLVSLLLQVLLLPVAYLLWLLVVGFFLQFLVGVGVRYCYGRGVGAALDLELVADPAAEWTAGEAGAVRDAPGSAVRRVDDDAEYDWRR